MEKKDQGPKTPMREIKLPDYLWLKLRRRALVERTDVQSFVQEAIESRLGLSSHPSTRRRRGRPRLSSPPPPQTSR